MATWLKWISDEHFPMQWSSVVRLAVVEQRQGPVRERLTEPLGRLTLSQFRPRLFSPCLRRVFGEGLAHRAHFGERILLSNAAGIGVRSGRRPDNAQEHTDADGFDGKKQDHFGVIGCQLIDRKQGE
ncbi:MAG: hypothetical protein AAF871_00205 [Pseudomonadota bacterium]